MSRNSRTNLSENIRREVEEELAQEIADQQSRPLRRSMPVQNLFTQASELESSTATELESSTETEIDSPPPMRRFTYINPELLSRAQAISGVLEEQNVEDEDFEEDHETYDSIKTDAESSQLDKTYIYENEIDETCKIEKGKKLSYNRKNMMKNCTSCYNYIDMENFKDTDNIVSIKIYDHIKGKLNKGLCINIDSIKDSIKTEIGNPNQTTFYSIYTKREGAKDTKAGHGSYPDNRIVVKLQIPGIIYITLGSLYTLLKGYEMSEEFYAVPLFGGKRRRVGNLEGAFYQSSNHGQIPGYIIYKLYTKRELKEGITADIDRMDFLFPIYIARTMGEMLELFSDTPQIRTIVLDSIIEYLLVDADNEKEIYV